jgi:hypothetical protein
MFWVVMVRCDPVLGRSGLSCGAVGLFVLGCCGHVMGRCDHVLGRSGLSCGAVGQF